MICPCTVITKKPDSAGNARPFGTLSALLPAHSLAPTATMPISVAPTPHHVPALLARHRVLPTRARVSVACRAESYRRANGNNGNNASVGVTSLSTRSFVRPSSSSSVAPSFGARDALLSTTKERGSTIRARFGVEETFVLTVVAGFILYIALNFEEIVAKQKVAVEKAMKEQDRAIGAATAQQKRATDAAKRAQKDAGRKAAEAAKEAQRKAGGK